MLNRSNLNLVIPQYSISYVQIIGENIEIQLYHNNLHNKHKVQAFLAYHHKLY